MTEKQDIFTILNGKVKFYHSHYNPTSDAVWLAAFAKRAKTVLDVGAGTGGVSLAYLVHNPESEITAIDISDDMIAECEKNAKLNNANLEIINADIINWKTSRTFDLVITNPPYFKGTAALHNAHHNADITKWVQSCIKRVKPQGEFCIISDAGTLDEIISALYPTFRNITIMPLFSRKNTAERVLVSAKLGSKTGTTVYSGFNMNDQNILRLGLTISQSLDIVDAS